MKGRWHWLLAWIPGFSSAWPLILQEDRSAFLYGSLKVAFQDDKSRSYKARAPEFTSIPQHRIGQSKYWVQPQMKRWGNRLHLFMGGAAKTSWPCEIYHRWLCGITMLQTPITEITTQHFAEVLFLFHSQRDRGTSTSGMISLKTFLFAQREKNLTCLICGEQHFLGWPPCISGKLITSKQWWDTAHIAKPLLAGGGSFLKIESVSLRIWSN